MFSSPCFRRCGLVIATLAIVFAYTASIIVEAAELVMVESEGCEWCEAWEEDIGDSYAKTSEAKIAPLRRIDIDDERPADLQHLNNLIYTPTFIVMREGQEVGRIIGYPGEDFFWQLLDEILEQMTVKQDGES